MEGKKCLIRTALALLKLVEDRLIKMSFEDAYEFLRTHFKDIALDGQTLMEVAFSFKITNSLLRDLEEFYKVFPEKVRRTQYKRL